MPIDQEKRKKSLQKTIIKKRMKELQEKLELGSYYSSEDEINLMLDLKYHANEIVKDIER